MDITKRILAVLLIAFVSLTVQAQLTPKEQAVQNFRKYFSEHAYRGHQLAKSKVEQLTSQQCIDLLGDDGRFVDLVKEQEEIEKEEMYLSNKKEVQTVVSKFGEKAFNRLWRIAQTFRGVTYDYYKNGKTLKKVYKAICNYGNIEASRGSISTGRFHESCFAIPTAAVNTYFCLFYAMDDIEKGNDQRELAVEANKYLKQLSFQSWTQPFRHDETDNKVVSVERFQKHVWWVGGNGLGFRSLLPTAAAMSSVQMMDVLAAVAKGGLSNVSQNTYDEAFWTEGFTADGAGWGHGMQCLIWGYPISGTSAALSLINYFKGTPWADELNEENAQALINYFRGSSWHYYKGYIPRCLGRMSMAYQGLEKVSIKTDGMVDTSIEDWLSSFTEAEQKELFDFREDLKDKQITMNSYPGGYYNGTRWFFNNDNLIKKNSSYYTFVSMASVRCDGIEMAHTMADKYNFFTCDGMTCFMKEGNEYHRAQGAWNLTAIPGVTSRQVDDNKLIPITNWRGYCSKHNFAAAATSGSKNAACGFIAEKMNASNKKDVNDTIGRDDPNKCIYGVKANKGYFMADDYLVALGAGIKNLNPGLEGDIWTTIDQTLYRGSMKYSTGNKETEISGDTALQLKDKNLVWAAQKGGFAYAVLPEYTTGEVFVSTETRKTKWNEINETNKKKKDLPQTEDIFQMYIKHGKKVTDGNYAYVVYAGEKEPVKAFENMPLTILENSIEIQAIKWGENYVGASFYNPGKTLKSKIGNFAVSAPCALLLEKAGNKWKLSVTDAEMNADLKSIEVKTTLEIDGDTVKKEGKWNTISIAMPQGALCGKPVTVELDTK